MSPKNIKKTIPNPRKPQFGWGKTMGCEKPLFCKKTWKQLFGIVFQGEAWCRWHCFLQGKSKILIVFCSKKNTLLGSILAPSRALPSTKHCFLQRNLHDFTKCVFEANKCTKTSRGSPKMAPSDPVMAPDSTPTQHPNRVCDCTKLLFISNLQA